VVDQATNEVENLRDNITHAGLFDSLTDLCAIPLEKDEPPLALSTLRGQFADNREWSKDPARPAVIAGTVDMIGSRLLFSGYGIGYKAKPLHAGFLGQDVLLVYDEAHLEPAFQSLLVRIQKEQERCKEFRSFRVLELSATSRERQDSSGEQAFGLTDAEQRSPAEIPDPPAKPIQVVWRRLKARKAVRLEAIHDEKQELGEQLASWALHPTFRDSGGAVLVFARTVENVERIISKLAKEKQQVQQLTGTMRGLERDNLLHDPIFARFLPSSNRPVGVQPSEGTVYLVCTSAGEVGVNISADHLICDLTTFESMAQRFGRVNRFGDRTDTQICVLHRSAENFDLEDQYELRRERTLELLQKLDGDGSPAALAKLDANLRQEAFAPAPTILPVTEILFDSWALTTIHEKLPGRPPVEPYLHGLAEWEPPETYVAWREEVGIIREALLYENAPEDLLEDYPLKPHELLRDRTDRVLKHLVRIAERVEGRQSPPVWLVSDDGSVEVLPLDELANKEAKERIEYRTVLLPPSAGGLTKRGLLDGDSVAATDVADEWFADKNRAIRRRQRLWDVEIAPAGMRLIRTINTSPDADEEQEESDAATRHKWSWYELSAIGETDASKIASFPVAWQVHTDDVEANARLIVRKLKLPDFLQLALILAARLHDLGKKRLLWQLDIGNPNPSEWLAKSGSRMRPRNLTSYRHEFGSLINSVNDPDFQRSSDDLKSLVLHLIATHHGRARPHFFQDEAFDPEPNGLDPATIAAEVPLRFASLQRKYGRWGLAYIESLLRAADYAASANPSQVKATTNG
jgi:CRISPR-associated endonuclease/helicase Cas3